MREYMKTKGLALLAASIAWATLLAACSAGVPAEGPTATPTVSMVTTPVPGTAAPTATERTPNLQFLPTAPPAPTARPADAPLTASDYYVVSKDDRKGVVDRNGKVVLPMSFASVDIVDMAKANQVLFYATPSQPGKPDVLYTREGKKIALPENVVYTYTWTGSHLINVSTRLPSEETATGEEYTGEVESGPYDGAPSAGAVNLAGKLVIPCRYYEIHQFGTAAAGLRRGKDPDTFYLDLFDSQEHAKGSVQIYNNSINEFRDSIQEAGDLLIVQTADGKYGALNDSLQWALAAEWDQIRYVSETEQLLLTKDDLTGVADQTGKVIIPAQYGCYEPGIDESGEVYLLYDVMVLHFFDPSGVQMFYPNGYDQVKYSHGVIIAQTPVQGGEVDDSDDPLASRSDLYDGQGNFILSIADDIREYDPRLSLFIGARHVYRADGTPLPLPDFGMVECLSADRFIVGMVGDPENTYGDTYGLCDAQGKWLLQPVYSNLTAFGDGLIVYAVPSGLNPYTLSEEMYGLADINGRLITGPVLYDFSFFENDGLAHVRTDTADGLMDSHLNWVWYASDYETLMD